MRKIAVVHDWLNGMRGGEKVLESVLQLFPSADLYCLFHVPESVSTEIESHRIYHSFIQYLPGVKSFYRYYLPLFPAAIERFNFKEYDLVISLSHCVAKGIITPPETHHVSYIFTPMRYAWDMAWEYFENEKISGVNRVLTSLFLNYLRMWDITSMQRIDTPVSISGFVAKRLKKYTGIDSAVIYPPVDTDYFAISRKDNGYYLIVSAFAPYKMIEHAMEAVSRLGKNLIIVGSGQMEKNLKRMASKNIEFTGWIPRERVLELMQGCTAFLLPGQEDFGIAALEAQSCGKPVIALGKGGALETIIPLESPYSPTGVFFYAPYPDSLAEGIRTFEKNRDKFDPSKIREHALRFSSKRFLTEFKNCLNKVLKDPLLLYA
ncbi:MAG TPA: glycosyltransferase [bacterium]